MKNVLHVALVYIDLDGFKPVNDTLGHYAGDKVLKVTSKRLREVIRHTDIAARMGGDEFALILQGVKTQRYRRGTQQDAAHRCHPYRHRWQGSPVYASAGSFIYPQDGRHPDELCRSADAAMYDAKKAKNTFRYHAEYRGDFEAG